jgi:hypothetical protein
MVEGKAMERKTLKATFASHQEHGPTYLDRSEDL